MTLSYEDVFSDFLGYITDYGIASMDTQDAYELMREWIKKAYAKPYLKSLFSSSNLDAEVQIITFEMKHPTDEQFDLEFVSDILAKGMVVEWLQPQVKSKLLTNQMFSGKEQKFFAQSNQLSELRGLLEDITIEQRKLIGERGGVFNTYLED